MRVVKGLNLACGSVYLENDTWINVDYHSVTPSVIACNLLKGLPFPASSFDFLYSSHFLEHLPRDDVHGFLVECRRVLKPGGVIRLVVPDCEEMFSTFLSLRSNQMHAEADFVLIEIIDQCVRQGPGGQLAEFYSRVHEMDPASKAYWTAFIAERTGERLDRAIPAHSSSSLSALSRSRLATVLTNPVSLRPKALARRFRLKIHQLGLRLLLPEFRRQNVSLAPIGERHCWLWDFHQLADALNTAGFVSVVRQTHLSSRINEFPFYPLDADLNDAPRMGRLSMYVEACVSGRLA